MHDLTWYQIFPKALQYGPLCDKHNVCCFTCSRSTALVAVPTTRPCQLALCGPLQATKWGQEEDEHSNFKLQPGHSKARHLGKHGALPAVLTGDAPKQEPAVPAWCSLEVTPGPGAYELQKVDSPLEQIKVPRAAFGATGDGKVVRYVAAQLLACLLDAQSIQKMCDYVYSCMSCSSVKI